MTSLRWFAVLQSAISVGLVAVLWVLYARIGRRPFFMWWAWAWTLYAVLLLLGALTLPLSTDWHVFRGGVLLVATLCGFLQPALLVCGGLSLRPSAIATPPRRTVAILLASALIAGTLSFGLSLGLPDALASFCARLAPRALALAGAAVFCAVALLRVRNQIGSQACTVTAISCLVYSLVQALYGVAAAGWLVAGPTAPLADVFSQDGALRQQLFLFDILSAYGICLGMVLLLIEDFKRSTQALEESLRLRQEALDENAVLQAEIRERRRVERALRESEDQYRDLVEHSEDLICTHDLEGRILMVNAPPARILGYSPDEVAGQTVEQLLAPESRQQFDAYLETLRRTGSAQGLMTVLTRSGDRRIWEYRSTLRTEGVPVPIVRGMARDVTERVTAERALRLSEAKFAAAFQATPCSIAISTIDEGRVVEINDACEAQTGYHRSEVIGRTGLELGLWSDPADRQAIVAEMKERGKVTSREVRWRSKAGDELSVLFSADTIAMRGQQYMLSVALDITAHKQVEARHRAILRALPDWMFLMSNQGVFLDCHVKDRTFLLAPPESFIGRNLIEVLPPRLADDLRTLFERVVRTDEPGSLEYEVPINGETRYYEARAVRCDHDKILSMVRDVTERKRAEHQARELGQELAHIGRVTTLAALTGSLAHEIRQPLAAIRTNAQAAQRLIVQSPGLSDLRSALADIVADSQRAVDVLQRVRALLKRDAPEHKPLDLNAGMREIAKVLHGDLLARHITLHVELEPDLPPVLGDRVQLQQVALNLVMNACDAVENQPDGRRRVLLRTESKESWVTVSVTDHGSGLTDAQLGQVFEPFYTTKINGMGLGLPICEMIMSFHDGKLDVARDVGQGMTFSFGLRALSGRAAVVGSPVTESASTTA